MNIRRLCLDSDCVNSGVSRNGPWDTSEKVMPKVTAVYVAYRAEDTTSLIIMNALEQQSQVKEEFEYVYKSSQSYREIKRVSKDEL